MFRFSFLATLAVSSLVMPIALVACDDADNLKDCHEICSRYQDCFDGNYDVSKCRSNCKDSADKDDTFQSKVDACEQCLDGKSCGESVFPCADECIGIVP